MRYGTLETTRSEAYYRYQAYGEPDGPQVLDYYFWIVRRGDETILVDTGFDPDVGRRRGRTCLIEPADAMAQLGRRPRDRLARRAHPPALRPHRQPRPLPRRRAARRGARPRLLARPARAPRAVRPRGRGERAGPGPGRGRRRARAPPGGRRGDRRGRARHPARRPLARADRARHRRASGAGSCSPPTRCTSTRSSSATGPSASSPTWPRCTRPTTRCASCPGPAPHLVPGHDAEVMTRYPRVEGPARDFAVEIR